MTATPSAAALQERRTFSENAFELGLFSFNCEGGLYQGKTRFWDGSWEKNVAAAQLAEEAGFDFLLPLSRWRGPRDYPIESDAEGGAYESLVWAAGILAVTKRIVVFATLNVAYANPVFAAKQIVTVDHIGRGRFGLNVVSGHGEDDNAMFGVPYGDHDARYDYTEEWVAIAKRVWSEAAPFDHAGKHFTLRRVLGKPKPYGGRMPTIISAGASMRGRAFAIGNAHAVFTAITNVETLAEELRVARSGAADGAAVPFYASGHVICRPTRKEADDYYHYLVYENGDWTVWRRPPPFALKTAPSPTVRWSV